ncbi:AMP-binding protein [Gordonia sp. HY002]|uniref:class I adenylate-forming enzyme family protein n=1 Tax=Gordonia zhenghanii TaxID=2911516 RepID=UPI001EF13B28|nr:AMP-binding protein [Gordonia zhenghanii]MCF8568778.1 AMP-binding protein [Gordonia zhenghanii]MCF8606111.1 AMP-binding protein [Gordonia zhenghanii]
MNTPNPISEATSVWSLLTDRVEQTPTAVALIDEHNRQETFTDVSDAAERTAAGLLALGVEPGSVVSWQLPTSIDAIVMSLALSRLGVVQNPIIPLYRGREVTAMVEQCASRWLITVGEFRGFDHARMADEVRASVPGSLRTLVLTGGLPQGDPTLLPPVRSGADEIRWIYTTSGTTSAPKGVCHTDGTLIGGGLGIVDAVEVTSADTGTILFPYAHIGGPDMLVASLSSGMSLVLMEVYEPAAAVELMRKHAVTFTGGSTPHYSLLLQQQRKQPGVPVVPTLRMLVGGGAPMPEKLFHEVFTEVGVAVLHGYGMTESPMIASARPSDTVDQLATTSGCAVRNCEIEIRSESDEVLPVGGVGRVWLRGPILFKHYIVDGTIVKPFDADGWFFTGDIGTLGREGHLTLVGREKDLIIRKGESISPSEIEDVVVAHPAIEDVAVIGLPDEVRGERICAVVQFVDPAQTICLDELREYCKKAGISPAKFPEQLEFVTELPKTPTMKIRKQKLRERFVDGQTVAHSPA